MMKRLAALFLSIFLLFGSAGFSLAETGVVKNEEKVNSVMEASGEESGSFVLPIRIGPVFSAIIRKDSIGLVFSAGKSRTVSMGLKTLSFLTNLKQIDVTLDNRAQYTIEAVVEFLNESVGDFIVLNLSNRTADTILKIITSGAKVVGFDFVQKNGSRISMTVDELIKALSEATGLFKVLANQAGQALSSLWQNISGGIGTLAQNAYSGVEGALVSGGDFFAGTAGNIGKSITDAANSAGEFIGNTAATAGEAVGNAAGTVGETLGNAAGAVKETIGNVAEAVGEKIGNVTGTVGETLGNAAETAGEALGNAAEGIGNFFNGLFGK